MKRKEYLVDGALRLLFAQESDRRLIYDLSISDKNILLSMFDDVNDFHWEDIRDEKAEFFDEKESLNKYLLIEYEDQIIGIFYHTFHNAPIANIEFHIWFVSQKFTGKGLGSKVVTLVKEKLYNKYQIKTFLMRPWIKNPQAVRAYEKCGFKQINDFVLEQYFTPSEIEKDGNGAYCEAQTINMIAIIDYLP